MIFHDNIASHLLYFKLDNFYKLNDSISFLMINYNQLVSHLTTVTDKKIIYSLIKRTFRQLQA